MNAAAPAVNNTAAAAAQDARETLARAIERRLPQTQCACCGHPGCLAYARALAAGEAGINQCPPGGAVTIDALARLLGRAPLPLNPAHGAPPPPQVARIREADCIGCALCIKACPVDCIIGAAKLMHSVVAAECSGCELCLPVCPTDCIVMTPRAAQSQSGAPSIWREFTRGQVEKWRMRAAQKRRRGRMREAQRANERRELHRRELRREILAAVRRKQARAACPPA
ncbi:MAG: RnfABCDGE type electron transport complex subunit B [Gammaproteobacteria bacterium]